MMEAEATTTATAVRRAVGGAYGLVALATVEFDIDAGQRLDAVYPGDCGLADAARKSVTHLALPHSNNQDEGDTQFVVRFRNTPDE